MRSSRVLAAAVLALALVAAACSDEHGSATTDSIGSTTATTSTLAPDTTPSSSSTTSSSSTSTSSTSSTSTTSTLVAVKGLGLSGAGLGDALFGADADGVVSYVQNILGSPSSDSGWTTPAAAGGTCSGTAVRFVTWNDLALYFTDDSPFATGLRHFAEYRYGPAFGTTINPYGLVTEKAIGVGSTVAQLKAAYPNVVILPASDISPATFVLDSGFMGFLSGVKGPDTITSFVGGFGCGE